MKNGKIPWLETNLLSFVRDHLWQIFLHPWALPLMLVFDCCPKYFANNTADFTPFRGKSIIQIFFSFFLFGQSRKIQCYDVSLLVHFLKKHAKVIWLQDCSSMWVWVTQLLCRKHFKLTFTSLYVWEWKMIMYKMTYQMWWGEEVKETMSL